MSTLQDEPEDPYLWLEDVESEESLEFAKSSNEACLAALGNPETTDKTQTYQRILAVLESDERIPSVSVMGYNNNKGQEAILYNFWKDSKNPKGLWRKTTLSSYMQEHPSWTTVLDVDDLAKQDGISWVYKGSRPLPRALDPLHSKQAATRALLMLSRGGADAVQVREFDLESATFVTDRPFVIPEAKTRASYKSRNVLLVGTAVSGDDTSLTDSGYPRTVREWKRGTPLEEAPIVFEGEKQDVSVSAYLSDERSWGGGIYEVRHRAMTFYTSKSWARKLTFEQLLKSDPEYNNNNNNMDDDNSELLPEFVPIDIPDDANAGFVGNLIVISLRSDWQPVPSEDKPATTTATYPKGSVIYTDADEFLTQGPAACHYQVLFTPTPRTAYEYYTLTKNYLILATTDNVRSKLQFFKIENTVEGTKATTTLAPVPGGETEPQIRDCSVRPFDPYSGSDVCWYSSNDYVTPSSLYLAEANKVEEAASTDAFVDTTQPPIKSLPHFYNAADVVVAQQVAISEDGTEIPYFIVRNKDLPLDGTNPTLLYGYGGFEVSLGPHYIATSGLAWLERGGVYVEANIRGGGEFGPSWHQAALREKRIKAYQDFIAVAEHLISTQICTAQTLAARGGSNGGLLIGNMYTMRPDLFGALHCAVPLLDMKRYHKLLAGASWVAEYGNGDTEDWEYLKNYSPYHCIDPEADYPPILVTTSTRDDRVHPGHARKFVKKLNDIGKGKWPVYYYENIEGGHGGAADAKQSAFMTSLAYDFIFETLSKNAQALKEGK